MLLDNVYTSSTSLIPETNKANSNTLNAINSITSLAFGSVNLNIEDILPKQYPRIINSTPFKLKLLDSYIYDEKINSDIKVSEYLTKYYIEEKQLSINRIFTFPIEFISSIFFSKKIDNIENNQLNKIIKLSENQHLLFEELNRLISINTLDRDNIISVSVRLDQKIGSSILLENAVNILENIVVDFKIKKIQDNLRYLEDLNKEKKVEFKEFQARLAEYKDKNKEINTERGSVELNNLQNEYNLAFRIYSDISAQLETQKIKLKENTPIFKVLEPIVLPNKKSEPKRLIIILLFTIVGFTISVLYFYHIKNIIDLYNQIKNS